MCEKGNGTIYARCRDAYKEEKGVLARDKEMHRYIKDQGGCLAKKPRMVLDKKASPIVA